MILQGRNYMSQLFSPTSFWKLRESAPDFMKLQAPSILYCLRPDLRSMLLVLLLEISEFNSTT